MKRAKNWIVLFTGEVRRPLQAVFLLQLSPAQFEWLRWTPRRTNQHSDLVFSWVQKSVQLECPRINCSMKGFTLAVFLNLEISFFFFEYRYRNCNCRRYQFSRTTSRLYRFTFGNFIEQWRAYVCMQRAVIETNPVAIILLTMYACLCLSHKRLPHASIALQLTMSTSSGKFLYPRALTGVTLVTQKGLKPAHVRRTRRPWYIVRII